MQARQHALVPKQVHFQPTLPEPVTSPTASRELVLASNQSAIEQIVNNHSITAQGSETQLQPHDPRRVLSTKLTAAPTSSPALDPDCIVGTDGKIYQRINNHRINYNVSNLQRQKEASLVDRC